MTRLLAGVRMANILRSTVTRALVRRCDLEPIKVGISVRRAMSTRRAYEEMERYWEKNRQTQRPVSPFLTTYRYHLPMTLSLTHRITGVVLSLAFVGAPIMFLCLPEAYPYYLQMVKELSLGPVILTGLKYSLALPVVYHFLNGIRHLAWDAGYGFSLPDVYKTGYAVLALTFLISSFLVFMM